MREKPETYRLDGDLPPLELPQIDMPLIDMQDLEHKPSAETRVNSKGVKVEPRIDSTDERDFAREDQAAIEALEELERSIRRQAPG